MTQTTETIGQDETKEDVVKNSNDILRQLDPSVLIKVLNNEDARTVAEIIGVLESAKASLILQNLPEKLQHETAVQIVRGERVLEDVLNLVVQDIVEKAQALIDKSYISLGGIDRMAELLNLMDRSCEKSLMEALENSEPELCEEVKKRMFVFEDIVMLDDRAIQKVLREIDMAEIARALKNVDDEVKDKIFRNMSKRAAALLNEEMEFMGPVRIKDIEETQMRIVSVIRRLEDCGEIVIARSGEDEMII